MGSQLVVGGGTVEGVHQVALHLSVEPLPGGVADGGALGAHDGVGQQADLGDLDLADQHLGPFIKVEKSQYMQDI